jgi:hypothetical protein
VALQATSSSHCLFGATSSVAVSFISIELRRRLLNARVIIMVKKIHTIPQKLEIIRTLESGKS